MTEQFRALLAVLRGSWADWNSVRLADLQFAQAGTARMAVAAIIGVTVAVLVLRTMARASAYRGRVALPALAAVATAGRGSMVRHAALLLGLAGLPFFVIALADPRTAVTREEVSYPGRRIA